MNNADATLNSANVIGECGHELSRSVLDRGGQEWWCPTCPTCAKEYAKKARQEWEANNQKWKDAGL